MALVFAFVAIMLIHSYSVPVIACVYVLAPPVRYAIYREFHRTELEDTVF